MQPTEHVPHHPSSFLRPATSSSRDLPSPNSSMSATQRRTAPLLVLLLQLASCNGAELKGLSVVHTKKQLTLEAADAMAQAAILEAQAKKFNAISVAVLDASGRELVVKTMPACPQLIPSIAKGKAGAAIGTHANSRALKDKYLPDRLAQLVTMTTIGAANEMPFAAVPGGVLVRDADGDVVGAIGVSGVNGCKDSNRTYREPHIHMPYTL